jgi:small GTP-binding protein
VKLQLWDTAGQ